MSSNKSHMSDAVRADTAKLTPELRRGLLAAANADRKPARVVTEDHPTGKVGGKS
jgi:hypothetical protein